jgi:hypothetical protein
MLGMVVLLVGAGLLDLLTSWSDVRGVDKVAVEDMVFAPLEVLGAVAFPLLAPDGKVTRATPAARSSSSVF